MKTINSTNNNDNASSIHNHRLLTDPQSGEVICKSCGQVLTDKVQLNNAEWCSFNTVEESTKSKTKRSDLTSKTRYGTCNHNRKDQQRCEWKHAECRNALYNG